MRSRSNSRRGVWAAIACSAVFVACSGEQAFPGDRSGVTSDGPSSVPSDRSSGDVAIEAPQMPATDGYDWSDVRRRQAISMAIDRDAIATNIFLGSSIPADDWWPPTHAGYRGGDSCANLQFDPGAARRLWDAAGGDVGPLTLWYNAGSANEEWIEAVANMLKTHLGVAEVDFRSLEFADYLPTLAGGGADGPFRLGWLMAYPSPGGFLAPLHTTGGAANLPGYSNAQFDALVRSGDGQRLADAIDDYQAAADILCEDMPIAPMFFAGLQAVHSEDVGGVEYDQFESLRLDELKDLDGDGSVSVKICEPAAGLYGQATVDMCGAEVVNALFTGLHSIDGAGNLIYDGVAESIATPDDGTHWTIVLEDGWTFHDGTPVTASSFVDAWNWAADSANGAPNQQFIEMLRIEGFDALNPSDADRADNRTGDEAAGRRPAAMVGLRAPDDRTIEIALERPFPQLPLVLAYNAFLPLPEVFFADPVAFGEAPVGNGPFLIDGEWQHDVKVATIANPDYAGAVPSVGAIEFRIYSDDATAYRDAMAGELDVLDRVPVAELAHFADAFAGRSLVRTTPAMVYLGFPLAR